jgi:hypothetical protein
MRITRLVAFALLCIAPMLASAQSGLTRLPGPKGGQIIYGNVVGATSLPAAMGIVLSTVHAQFGVKPEVSRVFELKGSDSAAVYFSVQPSGRPPAAGMIVVSRAPGGSNAGFEAGIVTDESSRLQTSFNPMLQMLFASWHPAGRDVGSGGGGPSAPVSGRPAGPLQPFTLPDRTASFGLPQGFTVTQASGGGSIFATGPHGEFIALGNALLVFDNSTPHGRQLQMQATSGNLRNTSYANNVFYPYGQPLGKTFVDLNRIQREKHRLPPLGMRVASEEPVQSQGPSRCARLHGEIAAHDNVGPAEFDSLFCSAPPNPSGGGFMTVNYTWIVPVDRANEERATMTASVASFRSDDAAVARMANQIAAPAIAQIHEIGRRAAQQAADADARRIASRQSYEARSNAQDRSNQAFSNYIRDQTVVVDRDNNAHGTVWNGTADAMVHSDPQRFGYVNTPNFWKGIDY